MTAPEQEKEFALNFTDRVLKVTEAAERRVSDEEEKLKIIRGTIEALVTLSTRKVFRDEGVRFVDCNTFAPYGCAQLILEVDHRSQVGAVWKALTDERGEEEEKLILQEGAYIVPFMYYILEGKPYSESWKQIHPLYWKTYFDSSNKRQCCVSFYLLGNVANNNGNQLIKVNILIKNDPLIIRERGMSLSEKREGQSPYYMDAFIGGYFMNGESLTYSGDTTRSTTKYWSIETSQVKTAALLELGIT